MKNNVLGTVVTASAAIRQEVSDFVLVSTDKAVRPANIMGASKRLAEMTLQALAAEKHSVKFLWLGLQRVGLVRSVVLKIQTANKEWWTSYDNTS